MSAGQVVQPAPWQAHFLKQARACEALGSPFTAALLRWLEGAMPEGAVAARIRDWDPGALGPDAVALRLAGGLHALVLLDRDEAQSACYPAPDRDPATAASDPSPVGMPVEIPAALAKLLPAVFARHEAHLLHWLDSAPQTNEIRRSAGLILAASLLASRFPGLPLQLSELGASAGLNLQFDHYAMALEGRRFGPGEGIAAPLLTLAPDWQGDLPPQVPYTVAEARGVDLNPLRSDAREDMLRLRSYIWADQPDRMARLEAALKGAVPPVDRGDAAEWLEARLAAPATGRLHLVYHTIAWQYFPETTKARCEAALARAGAAASPAAPLARLSMEDDGQRPGAALRLTAWPGGEERLLARIDFHGRWLQRV